MQFEKHDPNMIVGWYVADCVVNVSAKLEGEFADWPANIQDRIVDAMDAYDKALDRKHELLRAVCDFDVDTGWYVIVTIRAPKRLKDVGPTFQ